MEGWVCGGQGIGGCHSAIERSVVIVVDAHVEELPICLGGASLPRPHPPAMAAVEAAGSQPEAGGEEEDGYCQSGQAIRGVEEQLCVLSDAELCGVDSSWGSGHDGCALVSLSLLLVWVMYSRV